MNLAETLRAYEPMIRLAAFAGIFMAMALFWERLAPRATPGHRASSALAGQSRHRRARHAARPPRLPDRGRRRGAAGRIPWLGTVPYLQHVLFHAVPALWRLHRMHHAELEFDVTDARFPPIEILLAMAIKLGVVATPGAPAAAVLVFEVLFNHGDVRLPRRFDGVLRWIVVPDA